ncbi:MAG: hypothetical protein WB564_07435 [Dehalococcoidia bacterium]
MRGSRSEKANRFGCLVVILAGLPVVVSDTSPADNGIPDNEATTSQIGATNSSASATITIIMTTATNK